MSSFDELFAEAEQRYGLPRGYLRRTAQIESGMNPNAQNRNSSAGGLFQFIDDTAAAYGLSNRFDPVEATWAAARLARDNMQSLERRLGRSVTAAELYMAHQQGAAGAYSLLAGGSNPATNYVSYDAVRLNGGDRSMTAAQFAQSILDYYGGSSNADYSSPAPARQLSAAELARLEEQARLMSGGEQYIGMAQSSSGPSPLPANLVVPEAGQTPTYRSNRDERRFEIASEDGSFFDAAGAAVEAEWMGSWALAQLGAEEFAPDTSFQYSPELWTELTEGLPEAYHDIFDDAVSEAHARALRTRADEMVATDQTLAQLGGWGTALRVGAAIFDPVAIGATVATEGLAAPLIYGQKISRAGRALRIGATAGGTNAAVEAYIASQDPTRGARDVLLAGATGLIVGGALGHFIPSRMDTELEQVGRSMTSELAITAGDPRSMGAAYVGPDGVQFSAAERQLMQAEGDAPFSAMGNARIDMVGRLKQSEHPVIRRLAGYLAEDGVGNADGSPLVRSASEDVGLAVKTRMTQFYRTAEPAFREWARERGISMWSRNAAREEFFGEVGHAVRRMSGFYSDNAHVNKVTEAVRSMQRDLLAFAKDKGIRGFDNVTENSTYLMRVFNQRRLDEMTEQLGEGKLNRMVANAIISKSEGFDYEEALGVASAYLKSIRSQKYQDFKLSRVFSEDQADVLEEILLDAGELNAEQIASIVANVRKPQVEPEGRIGRAKRRLQLDETYRETYVDAQGRQFSIGVEDFLENNAERLITLYTRQITGAGFLEQALRHFQVPRLDGEVDNFAPSFETIVQHIRDTAGDLKMTPSQLNSEIDRLEVLYKAVAGIPLNNPSRRGEALRLLRDFNFIRVMNQVGFAQIAEIGNIIGAGGWRGTLQHVPSIRNIWKRAQDGSMSDELLDEIEVIWGLGTDRLRHANTNRMDDYGVYEGAAINSLDTALQRSKQITADISLMAPVNMALQRMAGRAAVQRWMNSALRKTAISDSRLASMGMSREMADRVHAQMLEHVSTEEGILGRAVKRLNIDEWSDQEAASAFVNAVDRWSRKIIQENDIGQMSKWMTEDLGRTLIQFRSFMVAAWTKQTLSGLHHRDWETFATWSTAILFGGLSYTAQTYINSIGRDDQKEFLQERLNSAALGRSAFQRAGFSTIVPGAADTMLTMAGFEPVFAYGRSTGMASDALFGNPTVDLLNSAARAGQGLIAAGLRDDYDFSQQDLNALKSVTPFQNAMGIRNIYHLLGNELPRWSE